MSRSPSIVAQQAQATLLENQDLIERNRNLELKLRYVQSVNTIFRQRVGILMQTLTSKIVELETVADAQVNLKDIFASVDRSINNANFPAINPEVAYWQDRFLECMSNIQPISQNEVETLCKLIREKVDRDAILFNNNNNNAASSSSSSPHRTGSSTSAAAAAAGGGGRGSSAGALVSVVSPSPVAPHHPGDDSVRSGSGGLVNYSNVVASEVIALREQLSQSEARVKSLSHRISEMRKQQQRQEDSKSDSSFSLIKDVGDLSATLKETRARLAEQESLNRRLTTEVNVLRSDKNLQLQHLSRMQGVCAAVMRESQCAVNEGLAATQMNETALLKRQMDTFELVLRKTEQEVVTSRRQLGEKDQLIAEKDREVQSLQLRMESKEKTLELLRQRCEAMATSEKEQREEQVRTITSLQSKLTEAVGELESAYTTKKISTGLETMQTSTEKFAQFRGQMDDLQKQFDALKKNHAALVEEVLLCVKQGRAPAGNIVENDAARILIGELSFPREAVLRTEGTWKEVRDLNEGSVFYVTNNVVGTPFDPNKEANNSAATAAAGSKSPQAKSLQPPSSPTKSPTTSVKEESPKSSQKEESPAPSVQPVKSEAELEKPQQQQQQQQQQEQEDAEKEKQEQEEQRKSPSPVAAQPEEESGKREEPAAAQEEKEKEKEKTPTASTPSENEQPAAAAAEKKEEEPSQATTPTTTSSSEEQTQPEPTSPTTTATSPASAAEEDELPAGWKKKIDEKSGKPYYYNPETKQTQWKAPKKEECTH